MAAVQFFGLDTVLQAFASRGIDSWAVFQGKQMNATGSGAESLKAFLTMINGGSAAIYTLNLYKSNEEPDEIDPGTVATCSFNFKLNEPGGYMAGAYGSGPPALIARIAELEREKKELESEEDDITFKKVIGMILESPEKLPQLINGLKLMFGMITGIPQQQPLETMQPALMGNVSPVRAGIDNVPNGQAQIAGEIDDRGNDTQVETRLNNCLQTLQAADPKILEHLECLAKLSIDKPKFFNMLIAQLDTM